MELILIRHPKTVVPDGVCYGATDVEAGPEHLTTAAERLRPILPAGARLVSSPQTRARSLADRLGEPETDARLVEMDFGAWEMRRWDDLPRGDIAGWAEDVTGYRPPGGETLDEVAARVVSWWEAQARDRDLVAVAHGGPWRCLGAHLLGIPIAHSSRLQIDWGARSVFRIEPHGVQLRGWNLP